MMSGQKIYLDVRPGNIQWKETSVGSDFRQNCIQQVGTSNQKTIEKC